MVKEVVVVSKYGFMEIEGCCGEEIWVIMVGWVVCAVEGASSNISIIEESR